jgi:hypothetical protein
MFVGLCLSLVLSFSASSFAEEKAKIDITKPMTINGNSLAVGRYAVVWEGNGPSVELKVLQGKKLVATVPAHLVSLHNATVNGAVVVDKQTGGDVLTEIDPVGKKFALVIGGEPAQTAADINSK